MCVCVCARARARMYTTIYIRGVCVWGGMNFIHFWFWFCSLSFCVLSCLTKIESGFVVLLIFMILLVHVYMRLVCIPVSSFDPPLDTIRRSVILVIVTFPGHINSWVLNLPIYDRD